MVGDAWCLVCGLWCIDAAPWCMDPCPRQVHEPGALELVPGAWCRVRNPGCTVPRRLKNCIKSTAWLNVAKLWGKVSNNVLSITAKKKKTSINSIRRPVLHFSGDVYGSTLRKIMKKYRVGEKSPRTKEWSSSVGARSSEKYTSVPRINSVAPTESENSKNFIGCPSSGSAPWCILLDHRCSVLIPGA